MIAYDLRRIKEESAYPDIRLPRRQLMVNPSYQQVNEFLNFVETQTLAAADIEVKGNEISHISIATSPLFCMSIPFIDGMNDYWTTEQEAAIWLRIAAILENDRIKKLFHNAAFDTAFMFRKMGIVTKNYECTMVGFAILMPDFPKGLDFLTSIYCGGEPYYKDDGKKYIKNQFGSEEVFQRYNAMDSCTCFESWLHIEPELQRQGNFSFYEKQRDLIDPLTFMQERGIRMNVAGLKAAADEAEVKIAEYEAELHKLAGFPLNVNSPPQMKNYFYVMKGFKPYTKKGGETITTDDMAMKRLSRKGCREAELVRLIRELRKAKGTYFEIGVDEDGRLRCSFNPVGTKSTRLSSSKTIFDTGGNLQNQPPEMLAFMLADEGYILCKFDLGQAENRVVAYVSNCQRMCEAFETGRDVHRLTAGLIFGIPPDEVSDEDGSCPIAGGAYSQRFWGKKANHGLNYDLGYKTFALYYELPEAEAK
jgi:DNA polymerase-1